MASESLQGLIFPRERAARVGLISMKIASPWLLAASLLSFLQREIMGSRCDDCVLGQLFLLDLVDYKVFGMDVHAACLASRKVARSSSYCDSLLFGHQGLFIPDNNYLLSQTVASYSSIHSTNSPPALAQPAMPSNRITLSISLSPCSSRWSLNHPAAREPRPREDAGEVSMSLYYMLRILEALNQDLQQYQMIFWTPADLNRLYSVGMVG